MSAGVSFGYLGNPVSTTQITGSYTIPAGQFAVVSASCKAGGTMTVNAVTVIHSSSNTWSALSGGTSLIKDNASGALLTATATPGGAGAAFTNVTAAAESANAQTMILKAGDVIGFTGTASASVALYSA